MLCLWQVNGIQKQLNSLADFIDQANKIHNSKYLYTDAVLKGMKEDIKIICQKHGDFWQRPDNHLMEIGCPKCSHTVSKLEIAWLDMLNIDQEDRHKVIKIGKRRFNVDGFVKQTNTVYEFYGDFWHGNPKKFPAHKTNIATKKTFGEMYQKTIDREEV